MKITITSPFANKLYCFDAYKKSFEMVIKNTDAEFTYLIYDNSNNPEFEPMVKSWAETLGIPFTYYKDTAQQLTIENTNQFMSISDRCIVVYSKIFGELIPESDLVFNWEDDITVDNPNALNNLIDILKKYPEVVTAVAPAIGRRQNAAFGVPIQWDFSYVYPPARMTVVTIPPKTFGIEEIGTAHLGFWLTRYSVLKEMGWVTLTNRPMKCNGGDINWGYRLWSMNKGKMACDYSSWCKHYFGKDQYVTYEGQNFVIPRKDITDYTEPVRLVAPITKGV